MPRKEKDYNAKLQTAIFFKPIFPLTTVLIGLYKTVTKLLRPAELKSLYKRVREHPSRWKRRPGLARPASCRSAGPGTALGPARWRSSPPAPHRAASWAPGTRQASAYQGAVSARFFCDPHEIPGSVATPATPAEGSRRPCGRSGWPRAGPCRLGLGLERSETAPWTELGGGTKNKGRGGC